MEVQTQQTTQRGSKSQAGQSQEANTQSERSYTRLTKAIWRRQGAETGFKHKGKQDTGETDQTTTEVGKHIEQSRTRFKIEQKKDLLSK